MQPTNCRTAKNSNGISLFYDDEFNSRHLQTSINGLKKQLKHINSQRIKDEAALALAQRMRHINETSTQMKTDNFINNQLIQTENHSNNNNHHRTKTTLATTTTRTSATSGAQLKCLKPQEEATTTTTTSLCLKFSTTVTINYSIAQRIKRRELMKDFKPFIKPLQKLFGSQPSSQLLSFKL